MIRRLIGVGALFAVVSLSSGHAGATSGGYDWLQFNVNAQHSGNNQAETALTSQNVAMLHRLFQVSLPATADGAPAYLSAVSTSSGIRDLLFLTTKTGHIVALDAHSGAQIWSRQYGAGSCRINGGGPSCYTTSSPAINPSRSYVYSYGLDGRVHEYQVGTGSEVMTGGWPQITTVKPYDEKGSSALSLASNATGVPFLYVANGGYPGDNGDYQGHITAINLSNGSQRVFNTLCSSQAVHFVHSPGSPDCPAVQSAVWARAPVIYDGPLNRIYLATGNGAYNPGNRYWGDSVLTLRPNGTGYSGSPLDSYTPTNYQQLQNADADLGSTAPAILPAPSNSSVQNLAVQAGKDGQLRLLNLANLSGQGGPGHTGGEVGPLVPVPQGGGVLTQPAVWTNPADSSTWMFVANGSGISALRLRLGSGGVPSLQPMWTSYSGGTSPIIANGVLYYARSNNLLALNPVTGAQLWHDTTIGGVHWESPIVDNGVLYVTDENGKLSAFGL